MSIGCEEFTDGVNEVSSAIETVSLVQSKLLEEVIGDCLTSTC